MWVCDLAECGDWRGEFGIFPIWGDADGVRKRIEWSLLSSLRHSR